MASPVCSFEVVRVQGDQRVAADDRVAVEEPLEIRLAFDGPGGARTEQPLSITMRTPGHDPSLALGFLVGEGIIRHRQDLAPEAAEQRHDNGVRVALRPGLPFDPARLQRHFYATSSCGVCGRSSLEALEVTGGPASDADGPRIDLATLSLLPSRMREAQATFTATGGLHATGLFSSRGELLSLHEDVGRHNAFDKMVGDALLREALPLSNHIVLLSGRASFELVQKAHMAGVRFLAAVGAPSSLAVSLARRHDITLAGFVRDGRCNLYAGEHRLVRERS